MSEDNWSLKGKEANVVRVSTNIDGTLGFQAYPIDLVYFGNDIEKLRQKLIEDIKELCDDRIGKAVISIINRRFGVEEEK